MKVTNDKGKESIRVMDIVATPKGGDIEDARFVEVKTVKDKDRNPAKKVAKKANRPGNIVAAGKTLVRGSFNVWQASKDENIFKRGAYVQRTGQDVGQRAVEWAVFTHDGGKDFKRELPIFKIIPPSD